MNFFIYYYLLTRGLGRFGDGVDFTSGDGWLEEDELTRWNESSRLSFDDISVIEIAIGFVLVACLIAILVLVLVAIAAGFYFLLS